MLLHGLCGDSDDSEVSKVDNVRIRSINKKSLYEAAARPDKPILGYNASMHHYLPIEEVSSSWTAAKSTHAKLSVGRLSASNRG